MGDIARARVGRDTDAREYGYRPTAPAILTSKPELAPCRHILHDKLSHTTSKKRMAQLQTQADILSSVSGGAADSCCRNE